MNTSLLARTLRPRHPAWPQWAGEFVQAWVRWRDHRRERARVRRELAAAADLSEEVLRDMGAPDWLVLEASARREVRALDLELKHLRDRADQAARYY